MRRLVRAAPLIVGGALALIASGCGGDGESDDPLVRLMQSANAADDELGARAVLRGSVTSGDDTVRIRGYGQIEADLKRDRFVFTAQGEREESFDDEPFTFIPVTEELASQLPPSVPNETEWLKVDQDVVAKAAGRQGLRELENLSPGEAVELISSLDPTIRTAGRERVLGIATTRYRITVAFGKLVALLTERAGRALGCQLANVKGSFRMVLWIDDQHLIRRMRLRLRADQQSIVMTSTITAYDRDLRVDVPSGPTVFDATSQIAKAAERAKKRQGERGCAPGKSETV